MVEGQIHRLKLIKRQMYGRASFDLLKASRPRIGLDLMRTHASAAPGARFTTSEPELTLRLKRTHGNHEHLGRDSKSYGKDSVLKSEFGRR